MIPVSYPATLRTSAIRPRVDIDDEVQKLKVSGHVTPLLVRMEQNEVTPEEVAEILVKFDGLWSTRLRHLVRSLIK